MQDDGGTVELRLGTHCQAHDSVSLVNAKDQLSAVIVKDTIISWRAGIKARWGHTTLRFPFMDRPPGSRDLMSLIMHSQTTAGLKSSTLSRNGAAKLDQVHRSHKFERHSFGIDSEELGIGTSLRYFDCEDPRLQTAGGELSLLAKFFKPLIKSSKGTVVATFFLAMLNLGIYSISYPHVGSCGVNFHVGQSGYSPISQAEITLLNAQVMPFYAKKQQVFQ